jgi:ABC-type enterochelin transport system substrate-binding protein
LGGAVVAGLLLAACGGGGGLSKADYVTRANAICREAAKQVTTLDAPGQSDVAELPKVAGKVVAVQRKALDRLKAIKAPKEDRTEIAKWIALVDQTIDQAEVSAQSQRSGDITRALAANLNGAALDKRADELARAYGLRRCVRAATPPSTTTTTTPPG